MLKGDTCIGKVRARGLTGAEPLQNGLRLRRLLGGVDLAPPGLPPQAILLIRRVGVSQRLSLAAPRVSRAWEVNVREAVNDLHHRAIRPVLENTVNGAEAVLFADKGEMLAWLGVETYVGVVEQRWYWPVVLQGRAVSSPRFLLQAWVESPRFLPAVIAYLAEWRQAIHVLQLFSPAHVSAILSALVVEHNLSQSLRGTTIEASIDASSQSGATTPEALAADHRATWPVGVKSDGETIVEPLRRLAKEPTSTSTLMPLGKPAWARWISQTETGWRELPPLTQHLLGVAITLFHAPAQARSERFVDEMKVWLRQAHQQAVASYGGAANVESTAFRPTPPGSVAIMDYATERQSTNTKVTEATVQTPDGSVRSSNKDGFGAGEQMEVAPPSFPPSPPRPPRSAAKMHDATEPESTNTEVTGASMPALHRSVKRSSEDTFDASDQVVAKPLPFWAGMDYGRTNLGGVLYLLNLFRQTELPECFDEDFRLSEHLSGWGLAELLGRMLLGPLNETYHDDPLWALLARLDGREPGEPPAAKFQCGDTYRMPTQWIKRFLPAGGPWRILAVPGRLTLLPQSGDFVIVDRPLNGATHEELAEAEAMHYRVQGIETQILPDGYESTLPEWAALNHLSELPAPLCRWLYWTFPFLRHLLAWALGVKPDDHEEITRELLWRCGRIYCTATHVDLVMSLEDISLPVRISGLDANPGWVHDLMRVVTFHFE